jgi:type II secretory pathway pseudopilin PulG
MLLEVLVAAVVAVVLITLLTRIAGDNRHRVERIRGVSGAMAVARSVLEEASGRDAIVAGERSGMAGIYRWVVVTDRLGDVEPSSSGADRTEDPKRGSEPPASWVLYRIGVAVVAPDGRRTTLEVHRLGRKRA